MKSSKLSTITFLLSLKISNNGPNSKWVASCMTLPWKYVNFSM
jgi:hypothetical protein